MWGVRILRRCMRQPRPNESQGALAPHLRPPSSTSAAASPHLGSGFRRRRAGAGMRAGDGKGDDVRAAWDTRAMAFVEPLSCRLGAAIAARRCGHVLTSPAREALPRDIGVVPLRLAMKNVLVSWNANYCSDGSLDGKTIGETAMSSVTIRIWTLPWSHAGGMPTRL